MERTLYNRFKEWESNLHRDCFEAVLFACSVDKELCDEFTRFVQKRSDEYRREREDEEKEDDKVRIELSKPGDNSPTCPSCGHWNAMLNRRELQDDTYITIYTCRDCGHTVNGGDCVIVYMKLDKPGMGNDSTYTEIKRVPGEDY